MEKRLYEVKKKGPTEECDSDHYELKETIDGATITTLYVETHAPNRKMLKWMLRSAVGLSRTLPQFAKDCSDPFKCRLNTKTINLPTLKRILSENDVVRPLKDDVIQALLNNADNPATVNGDDLMRANGLEDYRQVLLARQKATSLAVRLENEKRFLVLNARAAEDIRRKLNSVKSSAQTNWISVPNGTSVKNIPPTNTNRFWYGEEYGFLEPYGLNLAFMEADKKKIHSYWGFFVDSTEPGKDMDEVNLIRDHYEIFLYDIIHPDYLNDMKVSFVFQNQSGYNKAIEQLADYKVNNYFSVILIRKGEITAEYTLAKKDGSRPECCLGDFSEHYENDVFEDAVKYYENRLQTTDVPVFGY